MLTIKKSACGVYSISFMCETDSIEYENKFKKTGKSCGIDTGIKSIVVTSDGVDKGKSQFLKIVLKKLKKAQRLLNRKTKGSKRYEKQRIIVAKLHTKVASSRKDYLHKISSDLLKEYDITCIEDLNLKGMAKNRKLSRAISDTGIGELYRQLIYKAKWSGKEIIKISRWYPSTKTCSGCNKIHVMKLSDRVMKCECGLILGRDHNAAINIHCEGLRIRDLAILKETINRLGPVTINRLG